MSLVKFQRRFKFLCCSHRRSQHIQLLPEDPPHFQLPDRTGCGAVSHHTSAGRDQLERFREGFTSGTIDDDLQPTTVAELEDLAAPVGGTVVSAASGSHLPGLLEFGIAA